MYILFHPNLCISLLLCQFGKHFVTCLKMLYKWLFCKAEKTNKNRSEWYFNMFYYHVFQWMVDGRHGQSGQCVTAAVAVVSRNAHAAVPTLPHSMAAPSVKGKASRSWRVILSAQVWQKITIHPLRGGWKGYRCTETKYIKYDTNLCLHISLCLCLHPYVCVSLSHISSAVKITYPLTHSCTCLSSSSHLPFHSLCPHLSCLLCGSGWPVDRVE